MGTHRSESISQDLTNYVPLGQQMTMMNCIAPMTPSPSSSEISYKSACFQQDIKNESSYVTPQGNLPQYSCPQSSNQIWHPYLHSFPEPMSDQRQTGFAYTPSEIPEQELKFVPSSANPSSSQTSSLPVSSAGASKKSRKCNCPNCVPIDGMANVSKSQSKGLKKKHLCHLEGCGKVYNKTSHLKAHLRWHEGIRPFHCTFDKCAKTFTRSDELSRHARTHTGDKRFTCIHCGKGFTRSDHLAKHNKIHFKDPNEKAIKKIRKKSAVGAAQPNTELPQCKIEPNTQELVKIEPDLFKENLPVAKKSFSPYVYDHFSLPIPTYFSQTNYLSSMQVGDSIAQSNI